MRATTGMVIMQRRLKKIEWQARHSPSPPLATTTDYPCHHHHRRHTAQ
jgi:hypothetical protein